jgi:anti-sigma-K factor RskA
LPPRRDGAVGTPHYPRAVGTIRAHLVPLDAPQEGSRPALHEASPGTPVPLPALDPPQSRRPGWPTLAALAAGCGVAAMLLGAWALVAEVRSGDEASSPDSPALERAVAILAGPSTERFPLRGSMGRITLVMGSGERGLLALDGLGRAPEERIYAAWLVRPGTATPVRVATFSGDEPAVPLSRRVGRGARVGVTLEAESVPDRPSRTLRLVAVRD